MSESAYQGLLVIGDPHVEGRQPGFRKDDYPQVILEKLAWCLHYAAEHRLLPLILGDLFDKPRDNPTWMIGRLIELFNREIIGIYGNHDCADPQLCQDDTFDLLVKAGRMRLVSEDAPWRGRINGRAVVIGGSSYRVPLPRRFRPGGETADDSPLVFWLTHHDFQLPGYDQRGLQPLEIKGVDFVINGHVHRRLEEARTGQTRWLTPGNISRRSRSEANLEHTPAVLRIDITREQVHHEHVAVPHRPADEVFHPILPPEVAPLGQSAFVAGLADLRAGGIDIMEFLDKNLPQFEPAVAAEIMNLAHEVMDHEQS